MGFLNRLRRAMGIPVDRDAAPVGGGPDVRVDPRAPQPGDLGALERWGLPRGRLITSCEVPEIGPVAWLSATGEHSVLWSRLAARFPETGLWPLATRDDGPTPERLWIDGEFLGPGSEIGAAEEVLARGFAGNQPPSDCVERTGEPAGFPPGMAAGTRTGGPVDVLCPSAVSSLLLVPVTRPADVTARLGWLGPTNLDLTGGDVSAVLRSWEDRFGAVPIELGLDVLTLSVATPPTDPAQLGLLAEEVYALCPDIVDQGVGSIDGLEPMLRGRQWTFWWD